MAITTDRPKIRILSSAIEIPIPMIEIVVNIAHSKKIIFSFFTYITPTFIVYKNLYKKKTNIIKNKKVFQFENCAIIV